MAILRSCRKFNHIFTKLSMTCETRFAKQLFRVSKCRGYVRPIHSATYCCISENVGGPSTHDVANSQNNTSNDNNANSKMVVPRELQNCLEILSTEFNDMRVNYNGLLGALKIYAKLSDNVDDLIGIFLLNCCGQVLPDVKRELRQNLTGHVWKLLKKKNQKMSIVYYHTYLNVCAENCIKIEPEEFINSMNVVPDVETYGCLLNVAAKAGDLNGVNFILSKMKEMEYPLNHETFCALIEVHSQIGDMKLVDSIIGTMISLGIKPQNEFYGTLACGYAAQNDMENVLKILESHQIDNTNLLRIIKTLSLLDNGKDIKQIFQYLPREKILKDPLLHNTIVELVHFEKLDDALSVMEFFYDNCNSRITIHLAKHFLRAIVRAKVSENVIFKIAEEFSKIYSLETTMHLLLKESLLSPYRNMSLLILAEMKNKNIDIRPHYYWPLLRQASEKEGEPGIFEIVKYMTELGVNFDHNTLLDYILPYISTMQPMDTARKLTSYGIPISSVVSSLICYLLERGKIAQTLSLCTMISYDKFNLSESILSLVKAYKITGNAEDCTKILKLTAENKNYGAQFLLQLIDSKLFENDIVRVLKTFITVYEKYQLFISNQTAELIKNKLSLNYGHTDEVIESLALSLVVDGSRLQKIDFTPNSDMLHPRDMNEEQLESHLIELESKRLNTRGALRKLIMILCKGNNIERVEEIRRRFVEDNITITPGMKACLFEFYARNGQVGELCEIASDLQQNHPEFKIDSSKVLAGATALVKQNNVNTAMNIIENFDAPFEYTRGCWRLLDAIAHSEDAHLTDSTLDLLIKNGYCNINKTVLGPLVRQHLLKNDIPTAVDAFKMAAMKHKQTPLRQELVGILIENSNKGASDDNETKSMLQDVLQLITEIHGEYIVKMDMIVGYARCGMLAELQTALQNLNATDVLREQFISGMSDEVKLKILTTILDASHGIVNITRHLIYEWILSIYCKMGSCEDAINLWRRMSNEQIGPSEVFIEKLLELLSMHKVEIPVDLRAYGR